MITRAQLLIWVLLGSVTGTAQSADKPAETAAATATDLLIRAVTVVSPELANPARNTDVLIRDGRIQSLSPASDAVPQDLDSIDGKGLFLMPGLMDSHVHTVMVPGFPMSAENSSAASLALSTLHQRQQPRSYLYHGVTQVVDLAASPDLLRPFMSAVHRPHVMHCGAAPLATGYPTMFTRDSSLDALFPYHIVDNVEESSPERAVERMHDEGAVCVKLFFEDGFGEHSHWPMLSDDNIHRAIKAAKERKMRVVAHANALDMQSMALRFDVDVLAHGLWNWNQYRRESAMPEPISTHLDQLQARSIQFQPTMGVMTGLEKLFDENALADPGLRHVVPQSLLDWYATPEGRWFRDELIRDEGWEQLPDDTIRQFFKAGLDKGAQVLAYLHEQGYPLLLASDTPSSPTYGNQPGLNTLLELQSMHDAGVSLPALFRAATINNAVAFGVDHDYGTIEPGKIANMVLLERNPLQSIDAYNSIRYVIVDGRAHERAVFSALTDN